MADTPTSRSAVRDAADLFAAAEKLLAEGSDPEHVAGAIGAIARAAKALHGGHLEDAIAHVEGRGKTIAQNRPPSRLETLFPEQHIHGDADRDRVGPSMPLRPASDRHRAAVDDLVGSIVRPEDDEG